MSNINSAKRHATKKLRVAKRVSSPIVETSNYLNKQKALSEELSAVRNRERISQRELVDIVFDGNVSPDASSNLPAIREAQVLAQKLALDIANEYNIAPLDTSIVNSLFNLALSIPNNSEAEYYQRVYMNVNGDARFLKTRNIIRNLVVHPQRVISAIYNQYLIGKSTIEANVFETVLLLIFFVLDVLDLSTIKLDPLQALMLIYIQRFGVCGIAENNFINMIKNNTMPLRISGDLPNKLADIQLENLDEDTLRNVLKNLCDLGIVDIVDGKLHIVEALSLQYSQCSQSTI